MKKMQYLPEVKKLPSASGERIVSINHLLMIVPNVFLRNETYPLIFPGWLYNTYTEFAYPITLVYKNKFLVWGKNGERRFLLIWVCWIQIHK